MRAGQIKTTGVHWKASLLQKTEMNVERINREIAKARGAQYHEYGPIREHSAVGGAIGREGGGQWARELRRTRVAYRLFFFKTLGPASG